VSWARCPRSAGFPRRSRRASGGCRRPGAGADEQAHHADQLLEELDVTGYVGQYTFPDIARRRLPAAMYLVVAAACFVLWATHRGSSHVLVDEGFLWAAIGLFLVGLYHLAAAWPLAVRETDALVAAVRRV